VNFGAVTGVDSITQSDLEWLDTGAGILGTGGGGDPRIGRLRLRSLFENPDCPDRVEIVHPDDLDDDAAVVSVGGIGAPTISREKFPKGDEDYRSLRAVERAARQSVDAIVPGEIGGANSMAPLAVAAMAGLPVVDADGMGRAFPELQMDTFFIYGMSANYAAFTDEHGNQLVYRDVDTPERLEQFARAITIDMGGRAGFAFPLMDGRFVREYAITDTVSLAHELGRRVHEARDTGRDPVRAVTETLGGTELFTGKIVDVFRRTRDGFSKGDVEIEGLDVDRTLVVEFQNEFLVARDQEEGVLASVPDLVCILDTETAAPITTGSLRYGQRVRVVGVPAPDLLRTDRALSVVGPEAFGYDLSYDPLDSTADRRLDRRTDPGS
jgi:DUF917 family protein